MLTRYLEDERDAQLSALDKFHNQINDLIPDKVALYPELLVPPPTDDVEALREYVDRVLVFALELQESSDSLKKDMQRMAYQALGLAIAALILVQAHDSPVTE